MGLTKPRAAQIFNLDYKQSTRVVTTTNITLTGGAPNSVDGVNLSLNDRILVTGQTTGSQNGLYLVTTVGSGANGTWARTSDGNENGEIEAGMIVMVTEGTVYADTQWKLITDDPIVIGTTALTFTQNYMANSISSGTSNVTVNANANVTVSSAGTANVLLISSTGTVTSGTASITGNVTGGNVLTGGLVSATANITGGNINTTGNAVVGNILTNGYYYANGVVFSGGGGGGTPGGANTQIQFNNNGVFGGSAGLTFNNTTNAVATTGTFSATGNIQGGNILTAGLISATGNVTGGNLIAGTGASGNITGANVITANTVTTTANITGGNVLTAGLISAVGNIQSGNLRTAGLISATGAVTAASVVGGVMTGSSLSVTGIVTGASVVGGVMTGSSLSVTGTINGTTLTGTGLTVSTGNITGGNLLLSGAIVDSAQLDIQTSAANANIALTPNGTGIVTVSTQVSAVGNVTGGNIRTAGLITATANITGGNLLTAGLISATSTITSAANITGGNILTAGLISATGNVTGGNIRTAGLISATGAITGASVVGGVMTGSSLSVTGTINGTTLTGTSLTVSTGNVTCGNIVNSNANGVGNIGSATTYFNTVFAKATSAQYADLAEMYSADKNYTPGTVVAFGGEREITISTTSHATQVAGIISTNPSYLMNSSLDCANALEVALVGRVPCQVVGSIIKGDRLVTSNIAGVATVLDITQYQPGCIIGKALENYNSQDVGRIEVAVGRF